MKKRNRTPGRRVYMGAQKERPLVKIPTRLPRINDIIAGVASWLSGMRKGILAVAILLLLVGRLWFYVAIIKDLPDFDKIKDGFSQTTTITDKQGATLYKVYDQNRQYIAFDQASPHVVHALISAEDKDFWTNKGVDYNGIIRAMVRAATQGSLQGPGGSTITQQLIKNMLLTSDKKISRKLKEIVLATRIDDYLKTQVKKEKPDITSTELQRATKEKIMEMYMNYIFLGNNAYGIEAAASTYYAKKAKDLSVFESAVIASMPQSPSTLNPYRNVGHLVGALTIVDNETDEAIDTTAMTGVYADAKAKFAENIQTSDRSIAKSSNGVSDWLTARGSFSLEKDGKKFAVTYVPGRKDYVLSRMYEDGYIDVAQIKEAAREGIEYVFKTARTDIKAPHFVFWVQEFLKTQGCEEKLLPRCFTEEEISQGGLTVKTSLDGEAQDAAERSIKDNLDTIHGYGANNSSLLYVDSRDGDVLAYVGSTDYNDTGNDGKVDMVQQMRQPGSSIKPLVYSYGFMTLPLTLDTTIYDLKFKIGKDEPNNNDGGFMGPMPLKRALGYSRNIPAIKMYFAVGGQEKLVPFLNDLGVRSYDATKDYGYPMAIGSAEMKMIELTNAYMHLSAMGRPAKINPILEIRGPNGNIIYQKQPQQQQQIIPEGVAYLLWKILADSANLPASWVNNFKVGGLTYANKSGTTNWKDPKSDKILPRDGWLAGYTPSKVAIFWAGNTQGKPMNANAYGGWVNGKTFRQFFAELLKKGKIQTEEVSPVEVKNVTISRISGKLASQTTPESYSVSTMGYIKTLPTQYDDSFSSFQIDKACNGKITDQTPREDIKLGFLVKPSTFMPDGMDLGDVKNWFGLHFGGSGSVQGTGDAEGNIFDVSSFFSAQPTEVCSNRVVLSEDATIKVNIRKPTDGASVGAQTNVWYDVSSSKPITAVRVLVDGENIAEYAYNKSILSDVKKITIPTGTGTIHTLVVMALNADGGFAKSTITIKPGAADTTAPTLMEDRVSVTKKGEGQYTVVMMFTDDISAVKGGKILMKNGTVIKKFDGSALSMDIQIPQALDYEVSDTAGNVKKGTVDVSAYVKVE